MSERERSPGPWRWDDRQPHDILVDRDGVAVIVQASGVMVSEGNKPLIAAAPELLEALKTALYWWECERCADPEVGCEYPDCDYCRSRDLIRRIEGEE